LPRPGNVHTAENWRALPGPVAALYRKREVRRYFQADAAFAKPAIYRFLEADGHHSRPKLPGMGHIHCSRAIKSLAFALERVSTGKSRLHSSPVARQA
jgi:hypothetical protein